MRQRYIDIAKGFVIILMVLGHSALPEYPQRWIFSFHMPFFFMISGALTNWERDSWGAFCAGKTRALMLPFVVYSVVVLLCSPLYCVVGIFEHAKDVLLHGWGDYALWFVPVLWLALMVAKALMLVKNKVYVAALLLLLLMGCKMFSCHGCGLPWKINVVPFAASFVLIGAMLKDKLRSLDSLPARRLGVVMLVSAAVSFTAPLYIHLDMAHNILNYFVAGYVCAIAGSVLILCLSLFLDRNCGKCAGWLACAGRNTFVILAFSQMIIMGMNRHIPQLGVAKYLLLILMLCLMVCAKNVIVTQVKRIMI